MHFVQLTTEDTMHMVSERDGKAVQPGVVSYDSRARLFRVRNYENVIPYGSSYYWSLPSQFTGNRVSWKFYLVCAFLELSYVCLIDHLRSS